jgi:DNA mismatch repair protein MutS2
LNSLELSTNPEAVADLVSANLERPQPVTDYGIPERTLRHLEWPRLEAAWQARCRGRGPRKLELLFAPTHAEAVSALAQTREALTLLTAGEALPIGDLRDITASLDRLDRAGVLDAPALADIRSTLLHARDLRRFLGQRRESARALWLAASFDPSLDALEEQLAGVVELDGTLRDDASAELKRLRNEINALRERIMGRLQDVIDKHADLLSDNYYTLRDGRYVLPVRRDAHDRLPGIVHGESSSGASIFVEPRGVIEHGNRLKLAEAERTREELRILAAASELVRERTAQLRAAEHSLQLLDVRHAGALLGQAYEGHVPDLAEGATIALRKARHPALVLAGPGVVPNDMGIQAGRGLVISGPNAGGKTVVLKTLGLCALMVRAGLPLPAAEGSSIGFFSSVLTELGDEQSTATNLSTFSAHISHVANMLARADARSLVLLDELATGTDPGEGGALACALLNAFCARGAGVVVTTHYEALKAYAEHDPRLRSASVGLDAERLTPTFVLLLDVPGASSALHVAARFGLPKEVIAHAERLLPEQAREFEQLARSLSEAVGRARAQTEALDAEVRRAEAKRREYEALLEQAREQGKRKLARESEQLLAELRQARSELEQARSELKRGERKAEKLSAVQARLNEAASKIAPGSEVANVLRAETPAEAQSPAPKLQIGAKVYVPRLRAEGVVVEGAQKSKALIAVGAMKLWIETKDLRAPIAAAVESAPTRVHASVDEQTMRLPENTVDLRGLRADDALAMLDSFIDRLYGGSGRVGYVLHGHGTGALRAAVREHLRHVPYVRDSRPADEADGGDALTVFYLQ